MQKIAPKNGGVALIEMILYIALFSIIMLGLLSGFMLLSQNVDKNAHNINTQEEANFVLKKINFMLSDANKINSPAGNGSTLSTNKTNYAKNPTIMRYNATSRKIEICEGVCVNDSDYTAITSSNVTVDHLTFTHTPSASGTPPSTSATFSLSGKVHTITHHLKTW